MPSESLAGPTLPQPRCRQFRSFWCWSLVFSSLIGDIEVIQSRRCLTTISCRSPQSLFDQMTSPNLIRELERAVAAALVSTRVGVKGPGQNLLSREAAVVAGIWHRCRRLRAAYHYLPLSPHRFLQL